MEERLTQESLLDLLIEEKAKAQSPIHGLRSQFIGCTIDTSKLGELKFSRLDITSKDFDIWEKPLNRNNNRIMLGTGKRGTIAFIYYETLVDLQIDGGIGAPYGWYRTKSITVRTSNQIEEFLSNIVIKRSASDHETLFIEYLDKYYGEDRIKLTAQYSVSELLTGLANEAQEHKNIHLASIYSYALYKHKEHLVDISYPDLILLLGYLKYDLESYDLAIYLYENKNFAPELLSIIYANLGSEFSNNFGKFKLSYLCSLKAIGFAPNNKIALQNLFVQAKHLMAEHIRHNRYADAIKLGEDTQRIAGQFCRDHGFFSYLASAYEMIGVPDKALSLYRRALEMHPDCQLSDLGIKRINGASDQPSWVNAWYMVERASEYDVLERFHTLFDNT